MSCPFYGEQYTFTQPDGTQIKVKGWGDQHYAVFETEDGFTVTKDPVTGFYEYANITADANDYRPSGVPAGVVDPQNLGLNRGLRINRAAAKQKAMDAYQLMGVKRRCEVRRERQRTALRSAFTARGPAMAPPTRTMTGSYVGLCLLIDFPDVPATIPREEVDAFCNKKGYNGHGNNGSVYDYFYENSNELLEYTNIVTPYYTARHPRSYYTNPAVPYGARARELIIEALDNLKANGFDFDQVSADDEGYVYAINCYYASYRVNNWSEGLWPHSSSLARRYELSPGRSGFDYQITDMQNELSLATFCHENGHMICDYPDLYDYGYESNGSGGYCLMGFSGPDKKNPVQISAYLKYKSGWASTVTPVSNNMHASLQAAGNQYLILAKNRVEYFLVENRHKSGRDAGLPGSGLAIWHIDELGSNNNEHMTQASHYECALEQADGQYELEKGVNNGDDDDLFSANTNAVFSDTTEPSSKWWDGTSSNLELFDISAGAMQMTLSARFPQDGDIQTFQQQSTPEVPIPDFDETGIRDVIHFDDEASINSIKVAVDITHTYRGDLRVTLYAPSGKFVVLHKRTGYGTDNLKAEFDFSSMPELRGFVGDDMQGDWTLHVQDLAKVDTGRLNSWQLEIEGSVSTTGGQSAIVELEESPGVRIPDKDPTGVVSVINTQATGRIKEITAFVDISHTYIRDLIVTLISPAGTAVDLHHRMGGSADDISTTYDTGNTPSLEELLNESIQGQWQLKVSDVAWRDVGKLNHWSLRIVREI